MQIVKFMQALTQLAQQQSNTTSNAKMTELLRFFPRRRGTAAAAAAGEDSEDSLSAGTGGGAGAGDKQTAERGLFSDLFLAVHMFGSSIFFLPRFFQHIQKEAKLQHPASTRSTTNTIRENLPVQVEQPNNEIL